jgi:hypothetical protein
LALEILEIKNGLQMRPFRIESAFLLADMIRRDLTRKTLDFKTDLRQAETMKTGEAPETTGPLSTQMVAKRETGLASIEIQDRKKDLDTTGDLADPGSKRETAGLMVIDLRTTETPGRITASDLPTGDPNSTERAGPPVAHPTRADRLAGDPSVERGR